MPGSGQTVTLETFFHSSSNLLFGARASIEYPTLQALAAHAWVWIVIVSYTLSAIGFGLIVYLTVRIFELRKREEEHYSALIGVPATSAKNPRWQHVESLIRDDNPSHWREAVMEADIMLDEALGRRGYVGDSVGDKLKAVDHADLRTLQDAWDVHKIRNQIAHQGSAFKLSDTLARRTIARYEAVLRELKAI